MDSSCNCNTGPIAACVVEALIIVALVLVIIHLVTRYRLAYRGQNTDRSTKRNEEVLEGTENRGADNDLQELKHNKDIHGTILTLPEKNVKLVSLLPGKGRLQYHNAMVMRGRGIQEAVVKTLPDGSALKMTTILRLEVQHILELPNDDSIVKLIGWCNTVPNYVIYEFVRGGNLSDYLKEEISPHKVNQHGDTEQRRFEVTEKGHDERLPNYALQVARGLNFLTKNKFLHPGLRAKKVLLDTAGRCKLYDFVTLQNSNDWISLLWNEPIPFQWMPPEFLFLEKVSAVGDIWSFGVLLWEIFSYGTEPFIGQNRSDVERNLREKQQLLLPDNCPEAIWQLMITCWEQNVERRPQIDEVISKLATICKEDQETNQS